ncbi:histidine phosphatase family protein [uncultured Clostridium sp.]|uniref:histidine phosphatase family protein n=1 Tax=uncultured Clostridium sp. TaxID=59620 RepID=UPI0025E76B3E|nr:histidine phosphatase family protein [uncultured Clostridium sp.]
MTEIYLTRHGQTLWNLEKRLQGQGDSPLTDKGIKGAKLLGKRLEEIKLDVIYTSPIKRALETAKLIKGERNITLIEEKGLMEINFGDYEGHTEEEMLEIGKGQEISKIFNGEMDVVPPKGESLRMVYSRVKDTLDEILSREKGKKILIVTHGTTLKTIVSYFREDNEIYHEIMGQATLTKVIEKDGKFTFEYINNGDHLSLDTNQKVGW